MSVITVALTCCGDRKQNASYLTAEEPAVLQILYRRRRRYECYGRLSCNIHGHIVCP